MDGVEGHIFHECEWVAWTVICDADPKHLGCGATCGYDDTPEEAISKWNTRKEAK